MILVVAAAVGVFAFHRADGPPPMTSAEGRMPAQLVAIQDYRGVVVMSAADGRILRTLAPGPALIRYTSTLAVTPDGAMVYFSNSRRPAPHECRRGLVDEIFRVPTRGGPVIAISPGVFPAISPDGRLLAYTRNGADPCDSGHDELVIQDIQSGQRRTLTSPSGLVDLEFLSWAHDSVHLGYNEGFGRSEPSPEVIDTVTARSLADARPIPHDVNADWGGSMGSTGRNLGVTPRNGSSASPATVVELDATTGALCRRLFTIPGRLAVGNGGDGPEDELHADRSGHDVLAIGLLPVNASFRHGALYRWREGDSTPKLLSDWVSAAVWLDPPISGSVTGGLSLRLATSSCESRGIARARPRAIAG